MSAFAADLMKQRPALVIYARHLSHDPERSEDLASEAIARGWQYRERFEPGTNLRAWLSAILRNVFNNENYRRKFDGGYLEDMPDFELPVAPAQESRIELFYAERAMGRLPAQQCAALTAMALHGYAGAVAALGLPLGTIKSQVSRGRRTIIMAGL